MSWNNNGIFYKNTIANNEIVFDSGCFSFLIIITSDGTQYGSFINSHFRYFDDDYENKKEEKYK